MPARRKYPDELRERAVRLYTEAHPRRTIRLVANQVGVHPEALRSWIRQTKAASNSTPASDDGDLRLLRQEVSELRRSVELLREVNAHLLRQLEVHGR